MIEFVTRNTESFASLVNEGLRPDVPQPASYWVAALKTNECFRETVLKTPFQTLGIYLIAKAHKMYEERELGTDPPQTKGNSFDNATKGFATMIGLKALHQTYGESSSRQSSDLPSYGDVLNVIPHIMDEGHTDTETVAYMRGLWQVGTPDTFMQLFNVNALQYLGQRILFTHALKAMEMGVKPDSIDTIISNGENMHYFNSAIAVIAGKTQIHVMRNYGPKL